MTCKVSKKPIKPQILTGNFDRFYAQRGLGTCKNGYWQHVGWLPKENMLVKVLPGHYWEGYSPIRVNEVFIYVAVEFQDGRKALVPANFVHSLDGRD